MTEHEWLASNDPAAMLRWTHDLLQPSGTHGCSDRKLRLFAVACCRSVWSLLTDERSRQAVEVAERYADEGATGEALRVARDGANAAYDDGPNGPEAAPLFDAWASANPDAREAAKMITVAPDPVPYTIQTAILRDIVGNPFRPYRGTRKGEGYWIPEWSRGEPHRIARAAYEDRNPDGTLDAVRLAILGDALEEAGCPTEVSCPRGTLCTGWLEEGVHRFRRPCPCRATCRVPHPLLAHLRSPGLHYRGCWAVDCVLGKE